MRAVPAIVLNTNLIMNTLQKNYKNQQKVTDAKKTKLCRRATKVVRALKINLLFQLHFAKSRLILKANRTTSLVYNTDEAKRFLIF